MTDSPIPARLEEALEDRYALEQKLGEGGMATVYRARDLKHERRVALKVLKPELAAVIGAERFLAEIKTTANLQHPHILPLHDSGDVDGFLFYVMPYIEGDTLRDRLEKEHQLPVDEAMQIARDVGAALDYAHRQGVIHRDIKPANILLHEGRPQVADFGIALAVSEAGAGRLTETGLSMGTPHYMSPEQASGERSIDARTDIYALGCVLYEMLAGQPPFPGGSAQAVLASILTTDPPPVTTTRRTVPGHVDAALSKALEKLPADRFGSVREFSEALKDESFRHSIRQSAAHRAVTGAPDDSAATPASRRSSLLVRTLAATTLIFAALAGWGWLAPEPPKRVVRADFFLGNLTLPPLERIHVSPDGSTFAFAGGDVDGQTMLYVRRADDPVFRAVPGTESAATPDFSPNSEWIVYRDTDADALMKVAVSGGLPLTVVPDGEIRPYVPDWGDDGTIVFTGPQGPHRVADTGGSFEPLASLEGFPRLLPGGRGILESTNDESIRLLDTATDSVRTLIEEGVSPTYLSTGHLLYAHPDGGLQAVAFDLEKLEVRGPPVPVLDGVGNTWTGAFYSVSDEGTLVYVSGRSGSNLPGNDNEQLVILDRATGETISVPMDRREWENPRYSPDGRFVAYGSGGDPRHIFIYDIELGTTPRQLTFTGTNSSPVWSPDGDRVAFTSLRDGTDNWDLFVKALDDTPPAKIFTRPGYQQPTDWPSEDRLLFHDFAESSTPDLWMVDPSGDGEPEPYLRAEARLLQVDVSPDGTLAAYMSDEDGAPAVYVRSFPEPRQQSRVSPGQGRVPRWSPDGRTLYYWNLTGVDTLFAARVETEPTFSVLSVEPILTENLYDRAGLDVHPDGNRLLVVDDEPAGSGEEAEEAESVPERYIVVTNWFEELRRRMGGGN